MILLFLALACKPKPADTAPDPVVGEGPIVVWWTVDTLGERAAETTDWCDVLDAELGAHGLGVDCLGGAIAPSSWTAESHTRFLWPEHLEGPTRAAQTPSCHAIGVMQAAKAQHEVPYVWAADNPVFTWPVGELHCDGDEGTWSHGADDVFVTAEGFGTMLVAEAETPVHAGIEALLGHTAEGGAVAFFNDFEAGGHWPRCWIDPYTPPCEDLWQIGVAAGLVEQEDDRVEAWWRVDFEQGVMRKAIAYWADDPAALRGNFWATMEESIVYWREDRFLPRLRRLLDGLAEQDRLDDLVLVVTGDHGETPCVKSPVDGGMNCEHFGLPSEWTARVPVFVSPPELGERLRADGLAGDRETSWPLANVAYGLLPFAGGEVPSSWPAPEPIGQARSWTCRNGTKTVLHVAGDATLRCEGDTCEAFDWSFPEELVHEPLPVPTPDDLAPYAEPIGDDANWIMSVCP
jgi:hypothetical protein